MNLAGIGQGVKTTVDTARGIKDLFSDPTPLDPQAMSSDWRNALGERQFDLAKKLQMQNYLANQEKLDWKRSFRNAILGIGR